MSAEDRRDTRRSAYGLSSWRPEDFRPRPELLHQWNAYNIKARQAMYRNSWLQVDRVRPFSDALNAR